MTKTGSYLDQNKVAFCDKILVLPKAEASSELVILILAILGVGVPPTAPTEACFSSLSSATLDELEAKSTTLISASNSSLDCYSHLNTDSKRSCTCLLQWTWTMSTPPMKPGHPFSLCESRNAQSLGMAMSVRAFVWAMSKEIIQPYREFIFLQCVSRRWSAFMFLQALLTKDLCHLLNGMVFSLYWNSSFVPQCHYSLDCLSTSIMNSLFMTL